MLKEQVFIIKFAKFAMHTCRKIAEELKNIRDERASKIIENDENLFCVTVCQREVEDLRICFLEITKVT